MWNILRCAILALTSILAISNQTIGMESLHWNENYVAPDHDLYHGWYQKMQSHFSVNCCDEASQDCGPVADYVDYGSHRVKLLLEDGEWHFISETTHVFYVDTPDGKAHACRERDKDTQNKIFLDTFTFYCVYLPLPQIF